MRYFDLIEATLRETFASFVRTFGRPPSNPTPRALRSTFVYAVVAQRRSS